MIVSHIIAIVAVVGSPVIIVGPFAQMETVISVDEISRERIVVHPVLTDTGVQRGVIGINEAYDAVTDGPVKIQEVVTDVTVTIIIFKLL